jgi:TP901 family phage tail tape measure protein/lambda family phage tail tape measure protein
VADFRIKVIIDPRGAIAGADKVERRMKTLGKTAAGLRSQFAILFGGAAILAGVTASIRLLAGFEQTMSTVRGITTATDAEFKQLTETAKQLGATTRFTASQAGEGLLFLARAGFSVAEAIDTVDDTLRLAQAGALDLGTAADIASNVLTGFRLKTDQAARVVDVLALAANSANTTVGQLGQGLKFVAPVAAGLGVTIEETTAAIAALSNAGLQGTLAGTGLRKVLAELESPSKKTTDILRSLGVTIDQVRISDVGLTQALKVLAEAGVDTGKALEIFGQRGGPAFEVLSTSIPFVEEMTGKLGEAEGTAQRIAEVMDDNLNGALLAVKSAAQAVILEFGELAASGFLTSIFKSLAGALRTVAANMDTVLRVLKALVIALGVQLAGKAIPAAIAGFNALSRSVVRLTLAIAANPLGAIAVAITATVALLVAFADKIRIPGEEFTTLADIGVATFEFIRDAVKVAAEFLKERLLSAINVVVEAFGGINVTFADVLGFLKTFVNRFIGFFVGLSNVIRLLFKKLRDIIFGFLGPDFFKTIGSGITKVIDFAGKALAKLVSFAQKALELIGVGLEGINEQLGTDLQLPDFSVPPAIAELGAEIQSEFLKGFDKDFIGGAIDPILERARELAALRQGTEEEEAPSVQNRLGDAPGPGGAGGGTASDLQPILDGLQQQKELLALNNREREIATQLLSIEEDLTRSLTEAEKELVTSKLEELQSLELQASILEELRGPQEELLLRQEALNQLYKDGRISLQELNDETLTLAQKSAEASNTIGGGLSAGLLEVANRTKDLGKNIQTFVVGAFDKATDSLVEFATTGKFEFRSFAADLISQIGKLILQFALAAAVRAAFEGGSGGGGFLGGLFGGGGGGGGGGLPTGQNGLDSTVGGSGGTDSQLVAFRATPGERVQVSTPGQQGNMNQPIVVQAPPVNITNVQSADDIPLGIESAEGEQAVLNVLSRNAETLKSLTAQA